MLLAIKVYNFCIIAFALNLQILQSIVEAIRFNNPGREIPSNRVLGFASREDSNNFLSADLQRRVNGALHFAKSGSSISFTLQVNSSVSRPLDFIRQAFVEGSGPNPAISHA